MILPSATSLVLLAVAFLSTGTSANTKTLTKNSQQAGALQAAAIKLKPGNWLFQNVATGQKIQYIANGNHVFPGKGAGAALNVAQYSNPKVPWHRFEMGKKNKCLSSAFTNGANNAAVAYVCASGSGAQSTTLEQTKQWWLLVPVNAKISTSGSANSYANVQLIAAQNKSIATRNKKIAATKSAFGSRHRFARVKRHMIEKRANKTVGAGTFYIIATDHLIDTPARAMIGKVSVARGIKSTALGVWKKGTKNQQWKITKA